MKLGQSSLELFDSVRGKSHPPLSPIRVAGEDLVVRLFDNKLAKYSVMKLPFHFRHEWIECTSCVEAYHPTHFDTA